jgi:hypothetical protein
MQDTLGNGQADTGPLEFVLAVQALENAEQLIALGKPPALPGLTEFDNSGKIRKPPQM